MKMVPAALGLIGKSLGLNTDSWFNPFTGFGTGRDKTTHNNFEGNFRLSDMLLTDLYNHDDIARKVVAIVPDEMFREGFRLETENPQCAEDVIERADLLDLDTQFADGIRWARLYGGAVMMIGADDGNPADTPLDPERVTSVDFLDIFDRRRAWPWRYYQDPRHPRFGRPDVYCLQSLTGAIAYVHETRLIIFRGAHTDDYTRRTLNNWDYSILQVNYEAIQHFNEIFRAARIMMTDASQAVFTMKGLLGMIAGGMKQDLMTRAVTLDMGRSVARAIFLDADSGETFTKVPTQFAGVADQLTQAAKRLAAATGIPVIILMGETPSGLNASGDANVRLWYDTIHAQQKKTVIPHLKRIYRLIGNSLGYHDAKYDVIAKPLWQETPQEKATRRKMVADTDAVYMQNEVFTPEEVAEVRGGDDPDRDIKIDPTSRMGAFLPPKAPGGGAPQVPGPAPVKPLPAAPPSVIPKGTPPTGSTQSPDQEQPGGRPAVDKPKGSPP